VVPAVYMLVARNHGHVDKKDDEEEDPCPPEQAAELAASQAG